MSRVCAALVTNSGAMPSPTDVVTFDNFGPGFTVGSGPQQVGTPIGEDIVWTTTYSSSVIGCGGYLLGSNGYWNCGKAGHTGLSTGSGDMIFTFNSGLVNSVGGFINYAPGKGSNVVISAHACTGAVLESYDITVAAPISTPSGVNAGAFRGITRPSADICQFRVSNQYVVLDDLTFSEAAQVPNLNEWGMIIFMALAGLSSVYYLRRNKIKG
ncbi:MAG: hypothetical protein HZC48_12110 [Nitrospirae bacterium]|nr:hypothetical protein [Nitrospirota bacterium]